MEDNLIMQQYEFFPEMVKRMERLSLTIPGLTAWLLESKSNRQIVIMQFDQDFFSKESHKNEYSQCGVVLDGEIVLHIDVKQTMKKGDTFFIPKGMMHRVEIKAGYKDITFFDGLRHKK